MTVDDLWIDDLRMEAISELERVFPSYGNFIEQVGYSHRLDFEFEPHGPPSVIVTLSPGKYFRTKNDSAIQNIRNILPRNIGGFFG